MIITDFLLLDVQKEMDNDHLNTFSLFLFSFVLFFEKPIASIFKYTQKGKKILKGGVCRGGGREKNRFFFKRIHTKWFLL